MIHRPIARPHPSPDLADAYEETWQEWSDSGDESLWDAAVGDGIA